MPVAGTRFASALRWKSPSVLAGFWNEEMLRAEFDQKTNLLSLKLEGRLVGEWAVQVRAIILKRTIPLGVLVDMSEVSYIDSTGEDLLAWLSALHAEFVAETSYARDVCERLHLKLKKDVGRPSLPAAEVGRS